MIIDRKTDTTIFLLPVLGISRDKLEDNNFMDSFLDDVTKDAHYKECIYILFKPTDMAAFQDFLDTEKERYPEIIDDYDYAGGYVVVVYRFPEELVADMQLVLQGKYSETSMDFKKKFLQVRQIVTESGLRRDIPSLQWMVFKKAAVVREQWEKALDIVLDEDGEVWGVPDMKREVLDIEEIRKKEGPQHV
jgi:hypothetical protein